MKSKVIISSLLCVVSDYVHIYCMCIVVGSLCTLRYITVTFTEVSLDSMSAYHLIQFLCAQVFSPQAWSFVLLQYHLL